MRLTAVFDDREIVPGGDRFDPRHVGGLAVQVHREDCAGARTDCPRRLVRIERQAIRIDVGEHRPCAGHHHGQRRIGGRQRRRDHLVARPNPEAAEDERNRVGSGPDADGVPGTHRRRELRLERLDFRTENEPAARDHAIDGAANGCGVFARRQREKRNARRGHTRSAVCPRGAGT